MHVDVATSRSRSNSRLSESLRQPRIYTFTNQTVGLPSPLFFALVKQLPYSPRRKDDGLKEFQRRGWVLVDATYQPVNKRKDRDRVIEEDYECLRRDLSSLFKGRAPPIILIKVNVCRILRPKLLKDGFNVLNKGNDDIPFPSHSHQIKFGEMFGTLLKLHGLEA